MPRTAAAITLHTNLRAAVRMVVVAVITMVVAVITVVVAMAATGTKYVFHSSIHKNNHTRGPEQSGPRHSIRNFGVYIQHPKRIQIRPKVL